MSGPSAPVGHALAVVLAIAFAMSACSGAAVHETASVPKAAAVDNDGDGIGDNRDHCPGTARREAIVVDGLGCPRDTDNDGLADYRDKCPGTAQRADIDAAGCEVDADSDGVFDSRDRCLGTGRNERVDPSGCSASASRD